jgi:hypothetical protein
MKRPNICPLGPTNFENDITKITYAGFSQGTDALLGFKLVKGDPSLRQVILNAGYAENSAEFAFAFAIGTKEGWLVNANGGIGSRSYRNNNPGNLDYSRNLQIVAPGVTLEKNPYGKKNRFALFPTAELGAKALVETKIKRWANGNMIITPGNQELIAKNRGGIKYKSGTSPTIAQFVYTYAPPNENDTERYIRDLLKDVTKLDPNVTRTTPLNKFFK